MAYEFYNVQERRKGGIYSCHFHHITPEYGTIILLLGRPRCPRRATRQGRRNVKNYGGNMHICLGIICPKIGIGLSNFRNMVRISPHVLIRPWTQVAAI